MKNLLCLVLVLALASVASAAFPVWDASGDGTSFHDTNNWDIGSPGAGDLASVPGGVGTFPIILSTTETMDGLIIGDDLPGNGADGAALTITSSANLHCVQGTWGSFWVGYSFDATTVSAGNVTVDFYTYLGADGGHGDIGGGYLQITDGVWDTQFMLWQDIPGSNNHVQLDGGLLSVGSSVESGAGLFGLSTHSGQQTMDITGGVLEIQGNMTDTGYIDYTGRVLKLVLEYGNLSGYGQADMAHIGTWFDPVTGITKVVGLVPEPATMVLLGIGGLLLRRRKK